MKKISTFSILFLALCAFFLVLMRSCGGTEKLPEPTYTPTPVTQQPTEPPVTETPTPVVFNTPEPVEIPLWATDGINLRRSGDIKAEVITVISKDEKLLRLELPEGKWVKVRYNTFEGYVNTDYVTDCDPASLTAETPAPDGKSETGFEVTSCTDVVYTTDGVNLRRGPGKDYDVALSVDKNTKLERTGTTANGWSRVLYNSVGYFVSSDFVTTTVPAELAETETGEEPAAPAVNLGSTADSGEFRSDTGVALNILVRWNTVPTAEGKLNLNLSAVLISGPLTAAQYPDSLCFKVGNDTFNKAAPAVSVTENTLTETPLGSQSVTVEPGSVPVSVSWSFKGTYSGKEIDRVETSKTLILR